MGPVLRMRGVTKKNAFVQKGESWTVHEEVLKAISAMTEEIEGDAPLSLSICQGALKDEVYPESKAKAGKGRLFYVQDWTINHLMRRYALPIMQHLMMHPYETGVVVTLNAAGPAWGELAEFLKGDAGVRRIYAGDQSAYDMRHSVMIAHYVEFMVQVSARLGYTAAAQRSLSRILFKASRFLILLEGNWVLCSRTLGSGRSDTIVFNCVVIGLMTYYSSLSVYPDIHPCKVVRHTATGDDSNQSVAPEYDLLTGEVFVRNFAEGGYDLTSSDKRGPPVAQTIEEIDYLKRAFKWTSTPKGDFWFAPLAMESIARSMCYSVGISAAEARSRDVAAACSALREMFLHGEGAYNSFAAIVQKAFGDEVKVPTWRDLLDDYCSGTLASWAPPVVNGQPADPTPGGYTYQGDVLDHVTLEARDTKPSIRRGANADFPVSQPTPAASRQNRGRTKPATEQEQTTLNAVENLTLEPTEHPVQELRMMATEELAIKPPSTSLRKVTDGVNLAEFFARPRKVAELPSNVAGSFQVFATWKALPGVDKILSQYSLYRGNPTVTMVWTGSSQLMGLTRAAAFPTIISAPHGAYEGQGAKNSTDFSASTGYVTDSQLPHVDIDASEPATYKLALPFPLAREYLGATNNDWTIRQSPVNAIQKANGGTPDVLSVSYYVHYDNFEMERIVEQMGEGGEAPPGYLERAMGYAQEVASILPVRYVAPVQLAAGIGEKVARYFGLSKPPVEPQGATVIRHFGNSALASGQPNFGFSMGLDPDVQRSMAPEIIPLAQEGETTFKSLTGRPGQIVRNWAAGVGVQMTPSVYALDVTPPIRTFLTPIGYVAGGFEYWTGSLKVCVEIKSSPLVRWRIGVNIVPPGATFPLAYVADGSLLGYVIESVGSTCTEIEIPYLYNEPWRLTSLNDWSSVAGGETRLVYFALMDSVGPSATPVVPAVNLYLSAGEDFSCAVPTLKHFEPYTPQMSGGTATGLQAVETFGEVIDDLTLLTRRQVLSHVWTCDLVSWNTVNFPALGLDPGSPGYNNHPDETNATIELSGWTWKYWLSLMFIGNTGGQTFKVHIKRDSTRHGLVTLAGVRVVPSWGTFVANASAFYASLFDTSRGATTFDDELQYAEITLPDRNEYRFRYSRGIYSDGAATAESLQLHSFLPLGVDDRVSIWEGAADDYRVGGFLATPVLYFRSDTPPP